MKIAYVIDRLDVGGAERVAVDLANLMKMDGHDISVVTLVSKGVLAEDIHTGIPLYNLNRQAKFSLKKMKRLSDYLNNFDIVHIHMRHVLKYVILVKILFPFHAKIVFHDHYGKIVVDKKVSLSLKYILSQIDAYIGVDQQLYDWAVSSVKILQNKVWKLPNIVIPAAVHNETNNSIVFDNIKHLIVISNFKKEKNIEFAIILFEILSKYYSGQCKLDIYGNIADQDYFNTIKSLIRSKKLDKHINLITNCSNPRQFLYRYDLALHTAISESGPLVLMEYLSQGLPFISYRTGEVIQKIENEVPELIMQNWNEEEWVDRIKSLLDIPSMVNITNLTLLYEKYFSIKEYVKQCNQIYKNIINC